MRGGGFPDCCGTAQTALMSGLADDLVAEMTEDLWDKIVALRAKDRWNCGIPFSTLQWALTGDAKISLGGHLEGVNVWDFSDSMS